MRAGLFPSLILPKNWDVKRPKSNVDFSKKLWYNLLVKKERREKNVQKSLENPVTKS